MKKLKIESQEEPSDQLDPAQKKALWQLLIPFAAITIAVVGGFYYVFVLRPPH